MPKTVFTSFLILGVFFSILAQEKDSLLQSDHHHGYVELSKEPQIGAWETIGFEDFNQGNINDPMLLLRNRVAGLGVYKRGSDPNQAPHVRVRGLSTIIGSSEPLIVIDGVLGATLENVDPNDIASVTVLKSAAATALYGIRGGNGVLLVTTKSGISPDGFTASYRSYVATSLLLNPLPVMDAEAYIEAGGNDIGYNTDWLNEVSQIGLSHMHSVSVGGGSDKTSYRISLHARAVDGVLRKSGFDQINGRASLSHRSDDDRLRVNFNMSLTQRESTYSFREAFRYATTFNPTAPVKFESGDYWQAGIFDNFNPVALLEMNENDGKHKMLNYGISGSYQLLDGLQLHLNYAQQHINRLEGQFYHRQSFFRGINSNGYASRSWEDSELQQFETYVHFAPEWKRFDWSVTAGYSFTQQFEEQFTMAFSNLATNAIGYYGIDLSADRVLGQSSFGVNSYTLASDASPLERVSGFFGYTRIAPVKGLQVSASVRRDGSTRLGRNNRWANFYAVGAQLDVLQFVSLKAINSLKVRIDHGVTGNQPATYGQSQAQYIYSFNQGGRVDPLTAPNEDLRPETSTNTNVGLDISLLNNRISLRMDRFWRANEDLIVHRGVDPALFEDAFQFQFQNVIALKTQGTDLTLRATIIENERFRWATDLIMSNAKTSISKFVVEEFWIGTVLTPGGKIRGAINEEIGQIWSPIFEGLDENADPIYKDINQDGESNPWSWLDSDPRGDFTTTGSGLPSWELGWGNQLTFRGFDLSLFFRGAFGHSLINSYRLFYEPADNFATLSYNRVITDKRVEIPFPFFSSLFVERADFLRLDNLTFGYTFDVASSSKLQHLRVFSTVENAFTLTGYAGADPDPSVRDFGPTDSGAFPDLTNPNNLAPGIDRRNFYYTARTFLIGLEVRF